MTVRVAVIGVGRFGREHARVYSRLPGVKLVAVVDSDGGRAREVAQTHQTRALPDARELYGQVDAVSVATPTEFHRAVARPFLERGVAALVEKPIARSLADAEDLAAAARAGRAVLQVGHIERCNPAYRAARDHIRSPRYVKAVRFAPFRHRSADIDVVLDLMIHDLDLVLAHAAEDPARVDAVGMSVLFAHADRASARLEFADGCVAELDASRVATGVVRKMQIFTADEILALNFGERTCRRLRPSEPLREARKSVAALEKPAEGDLKKIPQDLYAVETLATPAEEEPLHAELSAFVRAVQGKEPPLVDGEHALRVMRAAERIRQEIREHRWT